MVAGAPTPPALIGRRALVVLRATGILTTIVFFGSGAVTAITGDVKAPLAVWLIPAVAALVVQVVCREPDRRVPELSYTIGVAAGIPAWIGGMGLLLGNFEPVPIATFVIGAAALALAYLWRGQRGSR